MKRQPKDEIDYLIDEVIKIASLYRFFGIRISEIRNFNCPHHPDDTPSARLMGNHVYCFAERRNYYSSDVLKEFSNEEYHKARRAIAIKYKNRIGGGKPQQTQVTIDVSPLKIFREGKASFDVVLDFLKSLGEKQHVY